ncbi:hypothetical protein B0T19DRAFT_143767 [Cercophora scortea]|uniref:Uncharacterized protein n=1 Tax=Cercophora scortea TaxID=314031 RepID=A0AAE0MJ15_9PEZI|nr:hypothetical protein B0T19DRAFT_143767 [Cercophora scortea]
MPRDLFRHRNYYATHAQPNLWPPLIPHGLRSPARPPPIYSRRRVAIIRAVMSTVRLYYWRKEGFSIGLKRGLRGVHPAEYQLVRLRPISKQPAPNARSSLSILTKSPRIPKKGTSKSQACTHQFILVSAVLLGSRPWIVCCEAPASGKDCCDRHQLQTSNFGDEARRSGDTERKGQNHPTAQHTYTHTHIRRPGEGRVAGWLLPLLLPLSVSQTCSVDDATQPAITESAPEDDESWSAKVLLVYALPACLYI